MAISAGLTTHANDVATASISPLNGIQQGQPDEQGFLSLLSERGLTGWIVQEGRPQSWQRDGETISCVAPGGGWLRTDRPFSDFILKLEYRLTPGANTGIGIRAPAEGNPTFTGLEIQLLDDTAPKYADLRADQYTGSVYYQAAATKKAPVRPIGEWNECEIRCAGDQLVVFVNGEMVNEVNLAQAGGQTSGTGASSRFLAQRPPVGHIALQSHTTQVDFRNIRVKDLTIRKESGLQYVDLSPGEGEPVPGKGTVSVHYVGQLADGKRFTDTRDTGKPVEVSLDDVILGLQEGIEGMKVGGKRRLIVPPELGYGSKGAGALIPPQATLVFEVEICGFHR